MQESTLADRLRKLRGNDSRRVFSLKYGIHEQSLIRYEKGIRTPDNEIIHRIADGEKVSFNWLRSGEGPMHIEDGSGETGDMSPVLPPHLQIQPIENIEFEKTKTGDMSPVLEIQQKLTEALQRGLAAQERISSLLEDKAELLLELERARMDVERRERRIRDLEKENAQLREAQKGAAALQHDAAWKTG